MHFSSRPPSIEVEDVVAKAKEDEEEVTPKVEIDWLQSNHNNKK